jgi:hypothetical protein
MQNALTGGGKRELVFQTLATRLMKVFQSALQHLYLGAMTGRRQVLEQSEYTLCTRGHMRRAPRLGRDGLILLEL